MKTSPTMQALITQLAQKHGLDLTQPHSSLCLRLPGQLPLVIEVLYDNHVSIGLYRPCGPSRWLLAERGVVLYTGDANWVVTEATYGVHGEWLLSAIIKPRRLAYWAPKRQMAQAEFAEAWAIRLQRQGWLEHGAPGAVDAPERDTPPDQETLLAWLDEGGCEATDGCWVEPDGACRHGCRSWLLELGLI